MNQVPYWVWILVALALIIVIILLVGGSVKVKL